MKLKMVVIDDHPMVRKGIMSILNGVPDIEVAGEAETVDQALNILRQCRPDIAIVDLRLGRRNGLEIIEKALEQEINCKFIIFTSSGNEHDFLRAEQLGVCGYVLKEALPEEIINAIRIISRGRKYYDPGIIELKMKGKNACSEELTAREQEVLAALGDGMSNRDIASKLYVTENTVKKHVSQVLAKLNLADRTQAALYAYSQGLVRKSV